MQRREELVENLLIVLTKKWIKMSDYKCYFDGSCEPHNPGGSMGMGVYIVSEDNEYVKSKKIKPNKNNTCNVAEYLALIMLLKIMSKKSGCNIEIFGDSMLVVNQISGLWKIKKGLYVQHAEIAQELYAQLQINNNTSINWIPREQNTVADSQSKL